MTMSMNVAKKSANKSTEKKRDDVEYGISGKYENNKNCFLNTKVHQLTYPQGFIYVIIHNGWRLARATHRKRKKNERTKGKQTALF